MCHTWCNGERHDDIFNNIINDDLYQQGHTHPGALLPWLLTSLENTRRGLNAVSMPCQRRRWWASNKTTSDPKLVFHSFTIFKDFSSKHYFMLS